MSDLITGDEIVYRVREVASMFRVSVMSVHRMIRTGELRAVRVGDRSIRITRTELERYVTANTTGAAVVAS